jgi:hypothetical protein
MKTLLLLFSTLISLSTYAQNSNRIIIKLKPGVTANKEAISRNELGLSKIDAINKANHFTAIQKLNSGKELTHSYL